jgi:ketosteroid isomerase-like protein
MAESDGDGAPFRQWLEALQGCVQRVDFESGRQLFVEEAVGFGTKASLAVGRDTLEANQWRGIWPHIEGFHFNLDDTRWDSSGDQAWAIATWGSRGFGPDGKTFDRPGRATVIFVRRDGAWRALHTHFSLFPGTPPTTRRPSAD